MSFTTAQLAELIGAELAGDESKEISGVARIEEAGPEDVTFLANPAYSKFLETTQAGAVILMEKTEACKAVQIITAEPYVGFLKALTAFHPPEPKPEPGIHPTAILGNNVEIGTGVYIGPYCVIEDGVKLGDNVQLRGHAFICRNVTIGNDTLVYSHVSIREGCSIGDRVILQNGAKIGSDGFGFAPQDMAYLKIPQVGIVVIEDDVEIGANTTIDRATLGVTRIRRGAKIDNLVQIAHGVDVGENTVIAAQSGVSGSSKIGANSMLGGQVGVSGHLRLSEGVKIAAQTGVHKDPGPGQIIGGYPARDIQQWRRIEASLSRLPDMVRKMRKVEKKLGLDED